MAQCIWCGKKGLLLSVDRNKLCRNCQSIIYFDFRQRLRIIQDSQKLIEKSKNFNTRIGRIDTLLEHVQALKRYEDKNITTLKPPPSEVERSYLKFRSELIFENIVEEIDKIMNKAKLGLTPKTKMSEANKALVKINERRREIQGEDEINMVEGKEKEIKTFIHETQLNEFIDEAKKAEFKGQKARALDKYQEALYFLQTDEIDDSFQKEKIAEIKAKISELT
ncbi:MAG: hypothetical protein ACFFDN_26405 [Candidatus Hodarchaeota archaeon]